MTVRIGDVTTVKRRRDRDEDEARTGFADRPRPTITGGLRRQRHSWWYHLEFALLKSHA
ncbi:hypothetical protein [Amycolatopsis alkalitolerans]|uniref:hypothetical protein n=1 Tax=Amycolatopsis alkalitolerans TaxID=2547244 RepID=UPI00135BFA94|nr:hypothetical protein [Amycolatopsis alkalitolerans]